MNAADPPPAAQLAAAARELLAWSDARDAELRARLAARASGYAEGLAQAAAEHGHGYAAAVADVKAAQHGIAREVLDGAAAEAARWELRGQARTRATFANPHPSDYLGGPVPWLPGWAPGAGNPPEVRAA